MNGARIVNAIEAAGGVTDKADLSKVNLAFVLSDGCKVRIPSVNDEDEDFVSVSVGSGNNVIVDGGDSTNGGKVNINTATQAELETLTGIGPSIAAKIINYRNENGKFGKIEDLKNVSGIGEEKFNSVKGEICVK